MRNCTVLSALLMILLGTSIGFSQIFPVDRLAGPAGTAGNWGIIDYYGDFTATAPADNVIQQILDIQDGAIDAESVEASYRWLDVTDPDTNGNGGPALTNTLGNGMYPYPSDGLTLSAPDDNDMISVAHARFQVQEPGKYTFNVHSDDGFALRIFGAAFESVQGNGSLDAASPDTMFHAADTGDSNTQAVVNLGAGAYNIEFMSWERAGGAFYEVTAAKGDFIAGVPGMQPQYLAVGDPSEAAQRTVFPQAGLGRLTAPLRIVNLNGIVPGDGVELLREDVLTAIDDGTIDAESNDGQIFVIDDNNISASGCPFGNFPHDGNVVQFPNTTGNVDNFASGIFGTFQIDDGDGVPNETMDVSVHVDSDDRSMFRIKGVDFTDVDAQTLLEIDGDDSMFGDVDTCNTNYTGLVTLTEGVDYEFEAFHVEAGGDAGMQVLFAEGDHLFDPAGADYLPLAMPGGDGITYARNIGFRLVPETEGDPCDFDGDGSLGVGDIDLLAAEVRAGTNSAGFDVTGDSLVNFDDIKFFVEDASKLNTWLGDANLDGEFNSSDFVQVFQANQFEDSTPLNSTWATGDWNGDGDFTSSDFVVAFQSNGFEMGPRGAVSAVPEPSGIMMVLLALAGLLRRRR